MPERASPAAALEPFVLLANGAKGAAAIGLIKQVLEAPGVYVFGELLDHPKIIELETSHADGACHLRLLRIFAYGTYSDYLTDKETPALPSLSANTVKKLRLLTLVSLATKSKLIKYSGLQHELKMDGVRELEDLIIDAINSNIIQGKLDQKASYFEVDWAMGRDIRKTDVTKIAKTLKDWRESCNGMLTCLENQAKRADEAKHDNITHQSEIKKKVQDIRAVMKSQKKFGDDDLHSEMDIENERRNHNRFNRHFNRQGRNSPF